MPQWFERYQQGFYQEVYDELQAMQQHVFDHAVYPAALLVAQTMMRRVRHNIELLIPRLRTIGYELVDGDWTSYWETKRHQKSSIATKEQAKLDKLFRTFRPPPTRTLSFLKKIEKNVGTLPLSVRCWYEEVGSVNLIGTLPATATRKELTVELDPLLILPVDFLLGQFPFEDAEEWEEAREEDGTLDLDLAVDADLKYDYSGSGGYAIRLPSATFDTIFDLSAYHKTSPTFVDYLRTSLRWGGFYGLATSTEASLTPEELSFLTNGFLPF